MTKLTPERLDKLQDNLLQFQDAYSDPADKENYDIFVDALHVLDEFKAAKEKLLAYEQAAKNLIGSFHISGGQVEATTDYCRDGEWPVQDGEVLVYAAPVLPKQPEPVAFEIIKEAWRLMDGQDPKTADWHFAASAYINAYHDTMPAQPEPENKIAKIKRQKALAWLKRVAYENPCMKEVKTCIEVLSAPAQPAMPVQEIVGWIFEDELPKNYPYDAMCPHSKVDVVRMFPVFAPNAAQPVSEPYKLPSGYALVPVEPTAGMINVGISEAMKLNANVRMVYQAMLAAAPAQESE